MPGSANGKCQSRRGKTRVRGKNNLNNLQSLSTSNQRPSNGDHSNQLKAFKKHVNLITNLIETIQLLSMYVCQTIILNSTPIKLNSTATHFADSRQLESHPVFYVFRRKAFSSACSLSLSGIENGFQSQTRR